MITFMYILAYIAVGVAIAKTWHSISVIPKEDKGLTLFACMTIWPIIAVIMGAFLVVGTLMTVFNYIAEKLL